MKFYKIDNLMNFGLCDYKGLDIDKFHAGSQAYKFDHSCCVIATAEEQIVEHSDLTELTEEQYITERQVIEAENNVQVVTAEQKIAQLESQVSDLELQIAQLAGGV